MKTYNQICGISRALDLVGDRWTLLIVRDLLLGPLHYAELQIGLTGITTNLLADRLKHLEGLGLVERQGVSRLAPYQLTEKGMTLQPVLFELGAWGMKHGKAPTQKTRKNLRWAMVSVRRKLRPIGSDYSIQFQTEEGANYSLWEKSGKASVEAKEIAGADLTVRGRSSEILGLIVDSALNPWDLDGILTTGQKEVWSYFISAVSGSR